MSLPRTAVFLFLGCAFAVTLGAYILTSGKIADHDPFVMGAVARRVAEGKSLYIDAWDNKPPLSLLFYYPSQAVAPRSYLAQQVFTCLWTAAQALVTFGLLHGERVWVRAVVAVLVLWMPLSRIDFAWGSSEDALNGFTMVLAVLGYRVLRDGTMRPALWMAAGLGAALALHTRQPGVLFLMLPITALFVSGQTWDARAHALALTTVGMAIGFVMVIGIMLVVSNWEAYVDSMFRMPFRYTDVTHDVANRSPGLIPPSDSPSTARSVGLSFFTMIGAKLPTMRSVLLYHFTTLATELLLALPVLAIFVVRGRRWRLLVVVLVCIGLAVVMAPMKRFGHYHQQLIPIFVLSALLILRELHVASPRLAGLVAAWLLTILFINVVLTAETLRADGGEKAEMDAVVRLVESESRTGDTLFAVGQNSAYIYYRSTLEPCHTVHWDRFFDWLAAFLPQDVDTVMAAIVAAPPDWIVIGRNERETFLLRPHEAQEGIVRTGKLLRRLHRTYTYRVAHEVRHWVVLRR